MAYGKTSRNLKKTVEKAQISSWVLLKDLKLLKERSSALSTSLGLPSTPKLRPHLMLCGSFPNK